VFHFPLLKGNAVPPEQEFIFVLSNGCVITFRETAWRPDRDERNGKIDALCKIVGRSKHVLSDKYAHEVKAQCDSQIVHLQSQGARRRD